ncbi:LysE family transporter [Bradyrhizobium diazoefficiens]|jgi:threonine/homoserine/homoserine lactone efflux protein|nr:LysE family transporter [Bradyrhizobium diazoefficiens]UCF55372.1 MAG: LysE family transporter [Bradyrhizobium sp.]MBR0966844.1 LysE family transporter [Bradyrhizobium diazoefficiens]MBR0980482.1 LysE family transporter [Bradyrhizobium diazoefficiens]MBR1009830.1 LysE family transporter [Bradyrhizobium diazoefficiens]MBR1016413.1 LysE family transporter [Bradyrhizobium diazoefficiens]
MSISQYIAALFSGVGIGFTVAAPIGPMGMLCIQRTLASGMATGLATGFGAATVHLAYSAFAVLGLGALARPWVEANAIGFGIVSALTLLWFAIRTHRGSVTLEETGECDRVRLARAYLSAIALGFTNPLTVILFLAALSAFSMQSAAAPLVAGVFVGSAVWWTVLSTTVATARSRLTPRMLSLSRRFASLMLLGLGATMLIRIAQQVF